MAGLGPIVGLAIMAGLALALLGCFLMKTGCVMLQDSQGGGNLALTPSSILGLLPREPGPERSSPAAEDQIQSSAQPNDKVTGAVGRGQERDWLEPGSFCHKLQAADTVVTGARADQPRMDGDVAVTYAVVGKGRSQVQDTRTAPIPSAPQARMSPTLAASLIGAPGKEMVMEPVNQPARTSIWVNR
ncbi:unnamed protein product [Natator depressus]